MIRVLIKGADDTRVAISPGEAVEHYGLHPDLFGS